MPPSGLAAGTSLSVSRAWKVRAKSVSYTHLELNGIYAEMPRACVASVGLMRRVPFTQSIGCACTGEVRGKNWDALYQLCEQRLKAAQTLSLIHI